MIDEKPRKRVTRTPRCLAGVTGTPQPMPADRRMAFRNDPTHHIWIARKRELLAEAEARGDVEQAAWLRQVLEACT